MSPVKLVGTLLFISVIGVFSTLSVPAPTQAELHFSAALKFEQQGHLYEAASEYQEAIRHDPQNTSAYVHQAIVYLSMGEYDRVLEVLVDLGEAQEPA